MSVTEIPELQVYFMQTSFVLASLWDPNCFVCVGEFLKVTSHTKEKSPATDLTEKY